MVLEAPETRNHVYYVVFEHFGLGGRQEAPRAPECTEAGNSAETMSFTWFSGAPGNQTPGFGVVIMAPFGPGGGTLGGGKVAT